jgi:hypothetical protein
MSYFKDKARQYDGTFSVRMTSIVVSGIEKSGINASFVPTIRYDVKCYSKEDPSDFIEFKRTSEPLSVIKNFIDEYGTFGSLGDDNTFLIHLSSMLLESGDKMQKFFRRFSAIVSDRFMKLALFEHDKKMTNGILDYLQSEGWNAKQIGGSASYEITIGGEDGFKAEIDMTDISWYCTFSAPEINNKKVSLTTHDPIGEYEKFVRKIQKDDINVSRKRSLPRHMDPEFGQEWL